MTTAIKRRRGTATEHATFTGLDGELSVDTTKKTVVVHDGATAGGSALAVDSTVVHKTGDETIAGVKTFTSNAVVAANTTTDALRITQTGTGNAFVVEDSTSPDSSPFVIDSAGKVVVGSTASLPSPVSYPLQVVGSGSMGMTLSRFDANATAPIAAFAKSRNATVGVFGTIVNSNDALGDLRFYGDDGVTAIEAARISVLVDGTPGTNDMPGRLVFSTTADGGSSPTERMRITSAGNVGIGTASPGAKLDVAVTGPNLVQQLVGASGVYSRIGTTTSSFYTIHNGTTDTFLYTAEASALRLGTNSTERMRIDSAGNVGIGTSSPGVRLDVKGLARSSIGNGTGAGGNAYAFYQFGTSAVNTENWHIGTEGDGSFRFYNQGFGAGIERMRITSAGNVGIGTNSPDALLTLNKASGAADIKFKVGGGLYGLAYASASDFTINSISAIPLLFGTNNTERARIDTDGNLLVGTTSYSFSTTNYGIGLKPNGETFWIANTPSNLIAFNRNNDGTVFKFFRSGTQVGAVSVTTTATAYATSSDYRLKDTIAPMTGALAKVAALKPCTYKWKADGSDGQGFIAHELDEVVPGCVTGEKDAVDSEGKPQYQGIDTSFLVATLTAAIQEQQALIQSLTTRITALEAK